MKIEARVLNLYLHQKPEQEKFRIWMAFNYTTERVFSWEESLLHGGDFSSGSINLGLNHTPEEVSLLIRKELEKMNHLPFPISEIDLHNGGDNKKGEKDKLDEREFYSIHGCLHSRKVKIPQEYNVLLISH
jgi:hypothetical protein